MGDLLDADFGLVEKNALYRCLDKLLAHKPALFSHLCQRWRDLFGASTLLALGSVDQQTAARGVGGASASGSASSVRSRSFRGARG